jgi:hypothetical protein
MADESSKVTILSSSSTAVNDKQALFLVGSIYGRYTDPATR